MSAIGLFMGIFWRAYLVRGRVKFIMKNREKEY